MKKIYSGFNTPHVLPGPPERVKYEIDFRCPSCGSEDVEPTGEIPQFYDGTPSTHDEFRQWTCNSCKHQQIGEKFEFSRSES